MARIGLVVKTTDKEAALLTSLRGVCDGCSERSACSFENFFGEGKTEIVTAANPIKAEPGEYVEFDLVGHAELKISLIVWVAPLVGLLVGAFGGAGLYERFSISQDIGVLLGSISGFLAVFAFVILFDRRSVGKKEFVPLILKVVGPPRSEKSRKASSSKTEPICPDMTFTTRSSSLPPYFSPHDPETGGNGSRPR